MAISANAVCAAGGSDARIRTPSAVPGSSRSGARPRSISGSRSAEPRASAALATIVIVRSTALAAPSATTRSCHVSDPSTTSSAARAGVRAIASAAANASAARANRARMPAVAAGIGSTLKVHSVITPSVPSDPTSSLFMS